MRLYFIFILFIFLTPLMCFSRGFIPIYISDNHASTFYWIWNQVDLAEPHTLILFDQHSDAGAVYQSDLIRKATQEPQEIRHQLAATWKKRGVIQCFNWLEPLVPFPIQEIKWVTPTLMTEEKAQEYKKSALQQLNQFEGQEPRPLLTSGFESRYFVLNLKDLQKLKSFPHPVIVSIDLDYFSNTPETELEKAFREVWTTVSSIPRLFGISIAISRPYLKSEKQSHTLLKLALEHATTIANARISLDPWLDTGPDRSLLAEKYIKEGKAVPHYQIKNAPKDLRTLILKEKDQINVKTFSQKWLQLLSRWEQGIKPPELTFHSDQEPLFFRSTYFFQEKQKFQINPRHIPQGTTIEWFLKRASLDRYNVTDLQDTFAKECSNVITTETIPITHFFRKNVINDQDLNPYFDKNTGFGQITLRAKFIHKGIEFWSRPFNLARYKDRSFPGLMTAAMNLPYIFGATLLTEPKRPRLGSDCSSLIVEAARLGGTPMSDANPGKLSSLLKKVATIDGFSSEGKFLSQGAPVHLTKNQMNQGLILHLGNHVAVLYSDLPPIGILNEEDQVIHQLEDKAQIIPVKMLPRIKKEFQLLELSKLDN